MLEVALKGNIIDSLTAVKTDVSACSSIVVSISSLQLWQQR